MSPEPSLDGSSSSSSSSSSLSDEVDLGSLYEPGSDCDEVIEDDPTLDSDNASIEHPFKPLSQLPRDEEMAIMASLQPQVEDVDSWSIAMSPEYFLKHFATMHTFVHLRVHYPGRIKDNKFFAEWLILADVGFRILVEWCFKKPFFASLKKYRTIQEARKKYSATYGIALVPISLFLHCLMEAGCKELRLQAYGQKLPLMNPFILSEPAQPNHPLAEMNEWDIGITTNASHIFLFGPIGTRPSGMCVYPMVIPRSSDFGSVKIVLSYEGEDYKVKVYPRLTHVLKSFNGKLHAADAKCTQTLKARKSVIERMIEHLSSLNANELGGFRLEVSVRAKTLAEAKHKALSLPFLKLDNWLNPTDQRMVRFKLQAMAITKKELVNNVTQMLAIANARDIWAGPNTGKVSNFRRQVVTDLFASLGWNSGRRTPTRSGNVKAWWREVEDGGKKTAQEVILGQLNSKFKHNGEMKMLFKKIQEHMANGKVPCKKDNRGVYQTFSDASRFRLRCSDKSCRHILSPSQVKEYFAQLIIQGTVPCTVVHLPPDAFNPRPQGLLSRSTETVRSRNVQFITDFSTSTTANISRNRLSEAARQTSDLLNTVMTSRGCVLKEGEVIRDEIRDGIDGRVGEVREGEMRSGERSANGEANRSDPREEEPGDAEGGERSEGEAMEGEETTPQLDMDENCSVSPLLHICMMAKMA